MDLEIVRYNIAFWLTTNRVPLLRVILKGKIKYKKGAGEGETVGGAIKLLKRKIRNERELIVSKLQTLSYYYLN